jgi:hypothetical protein
MAPVKCVSYPDPDSILAGDSGFRTKEEKGPTKKDESNSEISCFKAQPPYISTWNYEEFYCRLCRGRIE